MPGGGLTLGIQRDEFGGDFTNRLARLGFRVRPVAAAEPAQRRGLATDVAGQLIKGVHRHEQLVGIVSATSLLGRGILQHQVLAARAAYGALGHLDEFADAVLIVHHQIAGGQRQRVDDVAPPGRQPLALRCDDSVAGEVGLGDDHQTGTGHQQAGAQRTLEHPHHAGGRPRAGLQHLAGVSDSASCSTTRCAVPAPGATTTASPPVATWARSIAKSLLDAVRRARSGRRRRPDVERDRRLVGQLTQRPPRMPAGRRGGTDLVEFHGSPSRRDARCRSERHHRSPPPTTTPRGIPGRS